MGFFWIVKSFGIKAGILYLWDTMHLKFNKWFHSNKLKRTKSFNDLSDEDAEKTAISFGIHQWDDRDHLNKIWQSFKKTIN